MSDVKDEPLPSRADESDGTERRSGSYERWAPLFAAVLALALGGLGVLDGAATDDFALDDAWIHLDYAKSVRIGDGLSYNPDDWETGFSSPLWVLLLCVWPIGTEPVLPVKLLGVLLHAGTAWLAAGIVLDLGRDRASIERPLPLLSLALLAGTLVASAPTLVRASVSGMEVPLAALLLLATTRAAIRGAPRSAFALGALSVLARPEALAYLLVAGGVLGLLRHRRKDSAARVRAPLGSVVGGLTSIAGWVAYSYAVSGYPWPNTQYVKGAGGGLGGLNYVAQEVLPWQPWLVSLSGVVLIVLALRRDLVERRPELVAIVLGAAATIVGIALTRPLHPGVLFYESRYFAIVAAMAPMILPLGLAGRRPTLTGLLVVPVAIVTGLQLHEANALRRTQEEDTHQLHSTLARVIASELPADAVVGVEGAGAPRFYAPRTMTIVDLVGLNDREAAHRHFDREAKLCHFIDRNLTHMAIPTDWVPLFAEPFKLRPLQAFDDPLYTQVDPPRPLRVVLFAVDDVNPAWRQRCGSR